VVQDLFGIIHEDLVGHGMTNMLSNADKVSMALASVRWEVGVIQFIVDGFPPLEAKEGTDVIGRTGGSMLGDTSKRFIECVVEDEADIQKAK
jgi:hypothetical protein